MRIDILYFAGCPNHPPASALVRDVVRTLGLQATIRDIEVRDEAEAIRSRCFGSPTVQVDGEDIDPAVSGRSDYSLSCRMYGGSGVPPRALVERALQNARLRRAG